MTDQEKNRIINLTQDIDSLLKRRIDFLSSEMRDDRNDGWVKEHYRNTLKNIRDHINKALEK